MMLDVDWTTQALYAEASEADRRGEHESAARFRALANKVRVWRHNQRCGNNSKR